MTTMRRRRAQHPLLPLRDYQCEAARAIVASVAAREGRSFSVQIARQGGKNELSAQVELLLLAVARPPRRHHQVRADVPAAVRA